MGKRKRIIKLWEEKGSIPLKVATWCTGTPTRFIYATILIVGIEILIILIFLRWI